MKLNTKIFMALLSLAIIPCMAMVFEPQPDMVVYYARGNVNKISGRKTVALKKGDKLYLTDAINVPKQAELVLICKNHNGFRVSPGINIKLSSLTGKCTEKNNFTAAYFRFIWDELVENDKELNEENYLHNIGAVSRGAYRMNIWPDTINYFSGSVKVTWVNKTGTGSINVFDRAGDVDPFKKISYSNNSISLDSLTKGLKTPQVYYWNIANSSSLNKKRYYLRLWEAAAYHKKAADIFTDIIKTTPAETAYMSGFMMEKNYFLVEAAQFYKNASNLEPGNVIYKKAYKRFFE